MLKVKVKIVHISTVNISKMMTYMANIIIAMKYEAAYWLSIDIFRFYLVPF